MNSIWLKLIFISILILVLVFFFGAPIETLYVFFGIGLPVGFLVRYLVSRKRGIDFISGEKTGGRSVEKTDMELMINELIQIGKIPKITGGAGDEKYYWRPSGEGIGPFEQWDPRTREIGEELYKMADHTLEYMKLAHQRVVDSLEPLAGHALSANWSKIGEEEWKNGNGEVWDH